MKCSKKIIRAMLLSVIVASIACFERNAILGSISLSDRSEAERISGRRLRSPELGNPGSSSSVDESALGLAERIAGQPLTHVGIR